MTSARKVARRLARAIEESQLTDPFGGEVRWRDGKWEIMFAVRKMVGGRVLVYDRMVFIDSIGPAGDGPLAFEDPAVAEAYLRTRWVGVAALPASD